MSIKQLKAKLTYPLASYSWVFPLVSSHSFRVTVHLILFLFLVLDDPWYSPVQVVHTLANPVYCGSSIVILAYCELYHVLCPIVLTSCFSCALSVVLFSVDTLPHFSDPFEKLKCTELVQRVKLETLKMTQVRKWRFSTWYTWSTSNLFLMCWVSSPVTTG